MTFMKDITILSIVSSNPGQEERHLTGSSSDNVNNVVAIQRGMRRSWVASVTSVYSRLTMMVVTDP